ncbi:MAG: class I SAM-dependent methyltransferase [Pseudomonadota bacterium]
MGPETVDIAVVREFWDRRPCNIKHSRAPIGTREYFDQVEQRKYRVEPHIPGFADFERWRGRRVLEVGCGIGTDAINFARAGADYTGVELSTRTLEIARQRFACFGLSGHLLEGNAEELDKILEGQTFDLVYSFGVIHHTPDPARVIAHVKNHMTHESEFRLMLYARDSWKRIMIDAGFDQPEAQSGCPIAQTYSHAEISELLGDFDIVDLRQAHIFPYVIENYLQHEYVLQPWFRAMPKGMFEALEASLGWHTLIQCKLATR